MRIKNDLLTKFKAAEGLSAAPWLFCVCQLDPRKSRQCRHGHDIRTPAEDHTFGFINRRTKERVLTVHPYFSVLKANGTYDDPTKSSDGEARITVRSTGSATFENKSYSIPDFRTLCEQFAAERGLTAKVSFDSWYSPGRTLLVEYRKASARTQ